MVDFRNINNNFDISEFIEAGGHRIYVNLANYQFFRKRNFQHTTSVGLDGISFVLLYNFFAGRQVQRHSFDFTSDARNFLTYCINKNKKVCFIGGSLRDAENFRCKLIQYDLALSSWKFHSGFLASSGSSCWESYLKSLSISEFDIVILGLGAPLQEEVGFLISSLFPKVSTITCGAFISQTAGSAELAYYPNLINRLHLRWLFRLFKEPHVFRRLFFVYPVSAFFLVYDILEGNVKGTQ